MIVRKYVVPIAAVAGVAYMTMTVVSGSTPVIPSQPVAPPASSPFTSSVAGAGIVEASTENVSVGTHRAGIVSRVAVRVGQRVRAGDELFVIDERAAKAELSVREAALEAARAELARYESMPRAESVPPARARVAQAEAALRDAEAMYERARTAAEGGGAGVEETSRRQFARDVAAERVREAQSELDLLEAGAWKSDVEVARAQVASAEAAVQAARTELELLSVRAPIDGEVLQVNVRAGESASLDSDTPLIVMGETNTLHVRVDIDENDAWRVKPNTPASASLRGNSKLRTPITFVKIEPLVVPKRSLTGSSSERVDTRVLQAVYAFPREALPVYVGQLMDVYIEAPSATVQAAEAN